MMCENENYIAYNFQLFKKDNINDFPSYIVWWSSELTEDDRDKWTLNFYPSHATRTADNNFTCIATQIIDLIGKLTFQIFCLCTWVHRRGIQKPFSYFRLTTKAKAKAYASFGDYTHCNRICISIRLRYGPI